ncbi:MAG: agmatine deiminase family protein [Opitutaceae bacterium]|nr:agmatine deiminase family protein [Cytophagales bacterium]
MNTVFSEVTPSELGFFMPAEWQKQEAIWFSWPYNEETWPGLFDRIPGVYAQIVFHLSQDQIVKINVRDADHEKAVKNILLKANANLNAVKFYHIPTNDAWCRDHGPTFLIRNNNGLNEKAIINWQFNSWGGKYPFELDNAVPESILKFENYKSFNPGIVMEGGSIEVNGAGSVLTTKACLLNQNRNSHLSQSQVEDYLKAYLGINQVLWLEDGISGDDTNGHVDDLSRFVNENTIVTIMEEDPSDENYKILKENMHLLKGMRNLNGKPFDIISLPMPEPVIHQGERLPASYANFLIANKIVLVPVFQDKNDKVALDILQKCFPDRKIIGINCRDLVAGLGTLHCISQQEPFVSI